MATKEYGGQVSGWCVKARGGGSVTAMRYGVMSSVGYWQGGQGRLPAHSPICHTDLSTPTLVRHIVLSLVSSY